MELLEHNDLDTMAWRKELMEWIVANCPFLLWLPLALQENQKDSLGGPEDSWEEHRKKGPLPEIALSHV